MNKIILFIIVILLYFGCATNVTNESISDNKILNVNNTEYEKQLIIGTWIEERNDNINMIWTFNNNETYRIFVNETGDEGYGIYELDNNLNGIITFEVNMGCEVHIMISELKIEIIDNNKILLIRDNYGGIILKRII